MELFIVRYRNNNAIIRELVMAETPENAKSLVLDTFKSSVHYFDTEELNQMVDSIVVAQIESSESILCIEARSYNMQSGKCEAPIATVMALTDLDSDIDDFDDESFDAEKYSDSASESDIEEPVQ